jgi:hypothetical protein
MNVKMQIVGYGTVSGTLTADDGRFELTYRLKGINGTDKRNHPGMEYMTQTGQTLSELLSACAECGVSDIQRCDL